MPDAASQLTVELLTWISTRRRTYADAIEAWRSTCPRHTVWDDALLDGLVRTSTVRKPVWGAMGQRS